MKKIIRILKSLWPSLTVVALVVLAFVLWIGTLWGVPFLARFLVSMQPKPGAECVDAQHQLALYGAIGDMFGAANALFSALALGAVALTLYIQVREKRRDSKPILIPVFDSSEPDSGIRIASPGRRAGVVVLPVRLDAIVHNPTSEAALNPAVKVRIPSLEVEIERYLALPFAPTEKQPVVVQVDVTGENAKKFVSGLGEGKVTEVEFELSYSNILGVRWSSAMTLDVVLPADAENDKRLLEQAVDGEDSGIKSENSWSEQKRVMLTATTKPRSWRYVDA